LIRHVEAKKNIQDTKVTGLLFIDCTHHQATRELDQLHDQDDHNIGENHGVGRKSEVTLMDR
jgi:hypothetical protein